MQSESLGTWLPVILATAFNFGDTLGRVVREKRIVHFVKLSHNRRLVHLFIFSRLFLSSNLCIVIFPHTISGATIAHGITLDCNTRR